MSDKEAGNSFATIVFSEANYWINAVNDVFSSKMLPLLEEDSGYAQGAWCGLSYLSVISEELWRNIRVYWRQVLSDGEPYEDVRNARIKKTFLWSSILYDGSASREELFGACRHNPASCSAAVWVLVEWTCVSRKRTASENGADGLIRQSICYWKTRRAIENPPITCFVYAIKRRTTIPT